MPDFLLANALLPTGWARNVKLTVTGGVISAMEVNWISSDVERIEGIVLPGLPNLHSHTFQYGMAGLAEARSEDSDSFWTWRKVMYHFLERLTPDDVEAIASFAFVRMLEAGFTSVGEFHYLHHAIDGTPYDDVAELSGRIVRAAAASGIGLTLLPVFYAHGGFGGRSPDPGQRRFLNDLDRFARLFQDAAAHVATIPDAGIGVAPHSLRAVTREELGAVVELAAGRPIHIHVAEQVKEVEDCLAFSKRRPVAWLMDEAPVDSRWCLVHATHLDGSEIERLAASGAVAGLCPLTEANLGDGIFPGDEFFKLGGKLGVGSDSNVEIGAAAELKQLEYSQRLSLRRRNILAFGAGMSTGRSIYEAALAGGTQALGRSVGGIAVGNRADFVVLDRSHPGLAAIGPAAWLDAYIFAVGSDAVESVYVGGKKLVSEGRHRSYSQIMANYQATMRRLAA